MAREYEKSSGGIVYRKKDGKVEILLLKWLNSRNNEEYVIPKGHIEEGEIAKDAAVREISEEAGFNIKDLEVIKFITKLNYTFTAGYLEHSPTIDKDVYLFLVRYNGDKDPVVEKEERFVGYEWVDIDKIRDVDIKFELSSIVNRNRTYFI
ncbi:MAG: NUDIX domain-containing protein [Candidatus Gracilibacteria bacterium]|nr:NUDIX domain-containing protein [Candidatus Gracilibacteria bacterium]